MSWIGYGNEILLINQWKGIQNITCETNPLKPIPCLNDGAEVLKEAKMNEVKILYSEIII